MSGLLRSWVESANAPDADFPLNNLPYGVFSLDDETHRCGVALGAFVIDVAGLERAGHLAFQGTLQTGVWNDFMALGCDAWHDLRVALTALFAEGAEEGALQSFLIPLADVRLHMPFRVSEFTDFYASRHHATNVGTMFRGAENALPPNWLHIPIGYNGRASSVVVSGTDVRRPWGQVKSLEDDAPRFAPSAKFDIELELGAVVGQPSDGPLTVTEAFANIFGYVLLNDWSARDIQAWEYQPLGPFQSKATATSISPWIISSAALEPFRCAPPAREVPLLPHLQDDGPMTYDIALEVALQPEGGTETIIANTNASELYYSAAQQLAHHSACGCPMRAGDLLGSGTISGPTKSARGSMLELSWNGAEPFSINGGTRSFIEEGDTLTLRGHAKGQGYRIGFGECRGKVLPALPQKA
ncbi:MULTISPECIES: fumarylacetoacetase [Halocynthiibacter]|uniref:fumarylacetoacetase n=1 Tax=Halocynthiibacter halioticoli TaxID=2986804 RepID=A0AAE3IYV0_9RHOB|nr:MULTISPECIES: fumarylacetoacetase [Halocynthiibacter]MCV6824514.1 fumarylacetoacetase [Halocynthiibacter halioticoli]MCW4057515.1 fumarylacetoacetase [Halocynthiibacter sp. SDUM655004]